MINMIMLAKAKDVGVGVFKKCVCLFLIWTGDLAWH
jgi:hypothetical protein